MNDYPDVSSVNFATDAKYYISTFIKDKENFVRQCARYMYEYGEECGVSMANKDAPLFVYGVELEGLATAQATQRGFFVCVPSVLNRLYERGFINGYVRVSGKLCPTCGQKTE